jgi:tetratricopeptide (TPR) repeat protein
LIEWGATTAEIWSATGNVLTDVGEYAQAIAAYENSLQRDDANPETHHNLARVLYRLGEVDAAARHMEYALTRGAGIATWLSLARHSRITRVRSAANS